ncbi:MAG TPA: DUF4124 domain-containing protein [Steroidobacteraceae bacterium]|nr:DUF4124 domain-containing protein [Steroidobacteraceae bacterium]
MAVTAQAAVIYKWVDANGVVHYSDQDSPGAEKIVALGALNVGSSGAPHPTAAPQARPQAAGALKYSDFQITSPQADQTFFGDDPVGVHLNLNPVLKQGQSIAWHLNGKQLDDVADSVSFVLPKMDRGTYSLMAIITDQQTGESQSSNSVTFFVRQPSALSPQSPLRK